VPTPRDQLALAADLPLDEGVALYRRVQEHVGVAKVGLSLFVEHGPAAVLAFQAAGAKVFLDLKLHDIPNTVELASARAAKLGVAYLTVHASGGLAMLRAAVEGVRKGAAEAGLPPPRILAVTVLTSLDGAALAAVGVSDSPQVQVERLAAVGRQAGVDGVVCSPREAPALRQALGPAFLLCTPGIRPVGSDAGDQARAETPEAAVKAGADLLVVGRPIYGAADPVDAARKIVSAIAASQAS
jgi:orotidine-5'-phosphate decarboxylase